MKAIAYEVIDGFKIVRAIGEPTIDPELTKREVRKRLESSEEYKIFGRAYRVCAGLEGATAEEIAAARIRLFTILDDIVDLKRSILRDSGVFFSVPGELNVPCDRAEQIRKALSELEDHELLTIGGEVVRDDRGRRAWMLGDGGRWIYMIISEIGDTIPEGYRWSEDITPEELCEIREQMDRDRIAAMSHEERASRASVEIDAALDAIVRRHLRAQITGESCTHDGLRSEYEGAVDRIRKRYDLTADLAAVEALDA